VALAEKNWTEAAGPQLLGSIGTSRSSRKKVLGSTCQAEQSQGQPVALLDSRENGKVGGKLMRKTLTFKALELLSEGLIDG
jgi:hypothetical protein